MSREQAALGMSDYIEYYCDKEIVLDKPRPKNKELEMLKIVVEKMYTCTNLRFKRKDKELQRAQILGIGSFGSVWGINNLIIEHDDGHIEGPYNVALKLSIYSENVEDHYPYYIDFEEESQYGMYAARHKFGPDIYGAFYFKTIFKKSIRFIGVTIMQRYEMDLDTFLIITDKKEVPILIKKMIIRRMHEIVEQMTESGLFCYDIKPANFVIRKLNINDKKRDPNNINSWDIRMIDFGINGCTDELHDIIKNIRDDYGLKSITAPQDDPAFLTAKRYSSHNFTDCLSGQKKGFFLISEFFQFCLSHDINPNWVTAPIILNLIPIIFFKTIFATAPAATLQAVSLADCLPPPL